jgi:hypothetical protein
MSRALSLAGFQVTIIGRFWVTAEGERAPFSRTLPSWLWCNKCQQHLFFWVYQLVVSVRTVQRCLPRQIPPSADTHPLCFVFRLSYFLWIYCELFVTTGNKLLVRLAVTLLEWYRLQAALQRVPSPLKNVDFVVAIRVCCGFKIPPTLCHENR